MAPVQVITKILFYSIDSDLNIIKHDTLDQAKLIFNLKFILRHIIGYNSFSTNSGAVINNYATKIELLDINGNDIDYITDNDWKFRLDSFGMRHGYSYNTMWVEYTDTFGIKAREEFGISAEEVIKAYNRFQILNKFDGYRFAVVNIEKDKLILENLKLKSELERINAELSQLKSRLSSLS